MNLWSHLERAFGRDLAKTPAPEAPSVAPDLGHPLQNRGDSEPFEYGLTPQERDRAKLVAIELEERRRAANKRDEDADMARLGVEFMDGAQP